MSDNDFFDDKKVLVTGASGFLGMRLCVELKKRGAKIFGVSTEDQDGKDTVDQWMTGNLANLDFTKFIVEESKPEVIFHMAGYTSGQRALKAVVPSFRNNLTATVNLLSVSARADIRRLVLAGTLEEPRDGRTPVTPYAASKWAGTVYARMFYKLYDIPVTIPRIFMVYGPGDPNVDRLIPYVIRSLGSKQNPKLTSGRRLIDWIYIDDVVGGLIKMGYAEGIEGKTIDLGSGKQFSIRAVVKKIQSIMTSNTEPIFGERPDRVFETERVADLKNAKKYLHWQPEVDIDEGLKRTVEWYRQVE